jgi:hypothetical protein
LQPLQRRSVRAPHLLQAGRGSWQWEQHVCELECESEAELEAESRMLRNSSSAPSIVFMSFSNRSFSELFLFLDIGSSLVVGI